MEALPFLVFAGFVLVFYLQARREGLSTREWLAQRNVARSYTPGWWKPAAVFVPALLVLFVVVASAEHGFKWGYLLAVPILGGFFAAGTALLSWLFRRQQR
jgi:hypothetical protein